ncbi:hypothetical protein GIB67_013202, partial [Kingdonia uniflora]
SKLLKHTPNYKLRFSNSICLSYLSPFSLRRHYLHYHYLLLSFSASSIHSRLT